MKHLKSGPMALFTAMAAALAVAACGGGGTADTTPNGANAKITSVRVFGDSLADSGTFGIKFTVQGADSLIYPERVALTYGQTLCNFYVFTGTTFAANTKAGCTNFAIGGGVINMTSSAVDPRGIPVQLATAGATAYGAGELALIDGGGNDAANLVGAFLAAATDGGASYAGLLGTLLTPSQVGAAAAGGQAGLAAAGGTYMVALADKFYASIKTNVLDKGAQQVVVINIPGILVTPRFQFVLKSIEASQGVATRQQLEGVFKGWVEAFNAQIAAKFAGEARVAVIDIYTNLNDEVANPSQYALTNVTIPACPVKGVGSDGLPSYDFATCTASTAAAGYQSYLFSDSFHPTPYGHQLASQLIARTLAQKGWL
ncbi:MAG TPA: SGNH/GDSL hydrolase family protein [Burkholderiaceae bacterium]